MELLLDIQYAKQLINRLPLGKVIQSRPFRMQHRCIVCGDSKKNKYAARAWFYEGTTGKTKGVLLFNCFNCENNGKGPIPFSLFLQIHFRPLHERYIVEKFERGNYVSKPIEPVQQIKPEIVLDTTIKSPYYQSIADLPDTHPVKRYVRKRCIPEEKHCLLGFTLQWKRLANDIREGSFAEKSLFYDHPRLVIPIYTHSGLIAIQGRALRSEDTPRYQTIKVDDSFDKIYGTERIALDNTEPVVIVEGPIDSLFIDNCLAIVGGASALDHVPYAGNRSWWLDNEPRQTNTVRRIQKLISAGESVILWDNIDPALSKYKDINDCVQKGNAEIVYLNDYARYNSVSGLEAQLKFDNWRKV